MSGPGASCDIQIRVRYAECDPMGILHHARYFEFFEMGRTELLRTGGIRYRDLEARGVYFVVARMECRFRAPAFYDDLLVLTTRIDRVTRARIDHTYVLRREGRILAEAASTLACVDRTGRPMAIPDDVMQTTLRTE